MGLRQTLAGGIAMNKKKKGQKKKQSKDGESNYKSMTVPQLKDLCRSRSLAVGGIKSVIIDRLEAYDSAKAGEDDANEEEDANADDEDGDDNLLDAGKSAAEQVEGRESCCVCYEFDH